MVIDLSFLNLNSAILVNVLLAVAGIFLLFVLIAGFRLFLSWFWLPSRKSKYLKSVDFILLAIDIPKNNEQSPKAVEQVFSTLSGTLSGPNLYEKYWEGVHQLSFSLEVVCQEGYIQFYVHLPAKYRDVVEAAFYAQYPDAEIMEVGDYTQQLPDRFPNDTYNLWGTDIKLGAKNPYPIRTYQNFEHSLSQELKDPMASLLEAMSRLKKGEYLWLQWLITPTSDKWKAESEKEVRKIIGEETDQPKDFGYYITYPFLSFMKFLGDTLIVNAAGGADAQSDIKEPNKMQYLTSGQKDILQGIEMKMSKTAFLTKGRIIYAARREAFDKNRGVAAIMGAISQFSALNMNYFTKVSTTATSADYFRVESRLAKKQTKVLKAYKQRIPDEKFGNRPFILNIEELATIYHFPSLTVKAPLVKKIDSKRSEPPATLPVDQSGEDSEEFQVLTPGGVRKDALPTDLKVNEQTEMLDEEAEVVVPTGREESPVRPSEQPSPGNAPDNLPM